MARIRTVRPDFWEHEGIGSLSRDARLLYIASWNLADDEGLLRWTATYLKSNVFMYDDDLTTADVESLMAELTGYVFAYRGGTTQQRLGWIVNFRKHQRINRPQPSKLPAPSLQNLEVRRAYAERDGWLCSLCGSEIRRIETGAAPTLTMDHGVPKAAGGTDYPSNIAAAHEACNKSKRDGTVQPHRVDSARRSLNGSLNGSVTDSLPEGEGEGEGEEERGRGREGDRASAPPAPRCPQHLNHPNPPACGRCKEARQAREGWDRDVKEAADVAGLVVLRCRMCDVDGYAYEPGTRIPKTPWERCDHRPVRSVS
jgi:hypothetical protein